MTNAMMTTLATHMTPTTILALARCNRQACHHQTNQRYSYSWNNI
jgi:hypothetical protein